MASVAVVFPDMDDDENDNEAEERVALVVNDELNKNEKDGIDDALPEDNDYIMSGFKLCLGLLILGLCAAFLFTITGDQSAGELDMLQPDASNVTDEAVVFETPLEVKGKAETLEASTDSLVAGEETNVTKAAVAEIATTETTTEFETQVESEHVSKKPKLQVEEAAVAEIASTETTTKPETQLESETVSKQPELVTKAAVGGIASSETATEPEETQVESETLSKQPELQVEAPAHEQFANPVGEIDYTLFADEAPKVVYNSLRYRRMCADVGISSVLCMTIRFPFEVPEQDLNYSYTRPFTKEYYKLNKNNGLKIVDSQALEDCKKATANIPIEEAIKQCLETNSSDQEFHGAVVWTRRGKEGITRLYRTASPQQIERNLGIFEKDEMVIIGGASRAPGVLKSMVSLFGKCTGNGVAHRSRGSFYCEHNRRRLEYGYAHMNETQFYIGVNDNSYFAPLDTAGLSHDIPKVSAANLLALARAPGWTKLKPISIMVDFAWAHSQNHDMLTKDWEKFEYLMKGFPAYIMQLTEPAGKKELAERGFELKRIIVFDGSPQTFPTETGGYLSALSASKNEDMFIKNKGYPGWYPELGTACQGPLPPNSKSKEGMMIARKAFADIGFEMKWYGRTWEFANQFWFQTNTYGKHNGLDCTHARQNGVNNGYAGVNRWFFQAMVDDHYEHQT